MKIKMISQASIYGIDFYQKKMSPHKGYCCAYRYYTGKNSCSEFTKKSILKFGLLKSIPYFFEHLKKCKKVYELNRNNTNDKTPIETSKKNKKVDGCNEACGILACL